MCFGRKPIICFTMGLLFLVATPADSNDETNPDAKRGWYWYEIFEEQQDQPKEEKPQQAMVSEYSYDQLWTMHPDAFQAHLNQVTKQAVQFPTETNVAHYLKVQDVARRKSVAFAAVVDFVGQKNPQFSTAEDVYPTTSPGRVALTAMQAKEYDAVMREARNDFGLILFSNEDCGFCDAQQSILGFFENQYHWPIRSVDVNTNPNFVARFGIEQTPSIILVNKDSQEYLPVSSGVISMSDLKKRLYRSIRYMQGKISPEQWALYEFEKESGHDPLKFVSPKK
ncbi:MAG: conjugal transfer protein TraF [Thermodesulfobacteriota bacterium]